MTRTLPAPMVDGCRPPKRGNTRCRYACVSWPRTGGGNRHLLARVPVAFGRLTAGR
jgi:hypothetical protein